MSKLFSSIKIKDLEIKNRIVMAPMCMYSADNQGNPKDWHFAHYTTRAIGGVGLILQESTAVESRGRISSNDLGLWDDKHIEGLKKLVESVKSQGALMGVQLGHAGRKCEALEEKEIISSSPIAYSEEYRMPREMTKDDIKTVVKAFGDAARRCIEVGYDIIEIHGAHGYLINQFLSPVTNKRTDEYGGSVENRARFLKEVIHEIRKFWTIERPLILRVTAKDYVEEGNHPEDLAELINLVKDEGLDLINVSSGGLVNVVPKAFQGYQVKFAEVIKEKTGIPVIAGGLIIDPHMAEEVLQNDRADMIFLGRELLRNPNWPLLAAHELKDEVEWPFQFERAKLRRR